MNVEQFNHLQKWFHKYVKNITPDSGKLIHLIQLKLEHSINTAYYSRALGEDMRWSVSDILTAEALGLLHDVGRFSQIVKFGTFSDTGSINHGECGHKIIKQFNILSPLTGDDQARILDGIHYHNSVEIPQHINPDSLRFVKLVRDADKLDIFRVINDSIKNNRLDDYPEITLNIDINGPVNPLVLSQVLNKQIVSYKNVKSLADFGLTQLSWIYDINYKFTFQQIFDRRILEQVIELLPEEKEIQKVARAVKMFIAQKLQDPLK